MNKPGAKCQEFTVQWLQWSFGECNKWLSFVSSVGQCQQGASSGQSCRIDKQSFARTTNLLSEGGPLLVTQAYSWVMPF